MCQTTSTTFLNRRRGECFLPGAGSAEASGAPADVLPIQESRALPAWRGHIICHGKAWDRQRNTKLLAGTVKRDYGSTSLAEAGADNLSVVGAMHPIIPRNPNPLDVATQAERMARQEQGRWGLVFQAITAVSLAVVTSRMLLDMLRDHTRRQGNSANHAGGAGDDLGPAVRREVERALARREAGHSRGA